MQGSRYFNDVREIYESGRDVMNFDCKFSLVWESKEYLGLLRCHYADKGRYEIEMLLPGIIANEVADQVGDGYESSFCAFLPPGFYDQAPLFQPPRGVPGEIYDGGVRDRMPGSAWIS